MNWSKYQKDIFKFVDTEDQNLMIEAVAGSGKSTVLQECNAIYNRNVKIVNAAFNTSIKEALRSRLPYYREVGTLNGLGWGIYRQNIQDVVLNKEKNFNYLQKIISDKQLFWRVQRVCNRIVGLFKHLNYQAFPEDWIKICDEFGLEFDQDEKEVGEWAEKLFDYSINEIHVADFNDQVYQPIRQGWKGKKRDVAMIDEVQDLSPVQIELATSLAERLILVGDSFQSIYSFVGSLPDTIPNVIKKVDAKALPLSVCYRCPKKVVEMAQEYVPHIEYAEGAAEGTVESIKLEDFWKKVEPGDFVTCRTTNPLVSKCIESIRRGIKAFVRGRDIGESVLELINKVRKTDEINDFLKEINDYKIQRMERLNAMGRETEAMLINDRVTTIQVLSEQCERVSDFEPLINSIFTDRPTNGVEYSTIHKAKGQEKNRVFRLRAELCPHPKTPEHLRQVEFNCKYVEITRSKEYLGTIIEPRKF